LLPEVAVVVVLEMDHLVNPTIISQVTPALQRAVPVNPKAAMVVAVAEAEAASTAARVDSQPAVIRVHLAVKMASVSCLLGAV
jgi:hypothetical protein